MTAWWHGGLLSHSSIQWPQWMNPQRFGSGHWYKKPNSSGRVAPNKNVHGDFEDLPSRRDEPPPYWGWRLLFCVNLRGEALMISLNLHVNGDISLYACQGPAGLPDVKAKSISRPLPSCPSMHFIGTTLSLCSPALFPNELIGKKKEEGEKKSY